jgi:pimeloyl-ACP methyl ester carboxylesterase
MRVERVATGRLTMNVLSTERSDGEPVVFVHGNVSSALFFDETMLALPAGLRGVAPDLRGFGDTDAAPIDARRGLRDFADDLVALVAALGLAPVHLVGWSMGGGIVLQYLLDHPDDVISITLIDPVSPYGFGGTRGVYGAVSAADEAGCGGGAANPDFVRRLREGDRGDSPNSPRNVMNAFYFRPPFRAAREEDYLDSMLNTRVGDDFYPGDMRPSTNWPNIAPGDRGVLNTMAPGRMRLDRIIDVSPKPPILWVRGADDQIVSDQSFFDFGTLGKLGFVPDWPGDDVYPPQPMVTQTRAVLERYQAQGGAYQEVVIAAAGHSPHVEQPQRFREAFFAHLQRRR